MKQSLFSISILLFGLLILGACSKEDEPTKPIDIQPVSPYPTGTASFDANGYAFVATEARARYRVNGNGLGIELKNADGRSLILRIPGFTGVGIYSSPESVGVANYFYLFNSKFISWSSSLQNAQIEITAFDESEGLLSGNFSIELKYGNSSIYIEQGLLENIPIIKLLEPKSGNADFFLDDVYYRSEEPYAVLTNNFKLQIYTPYHYLDYTLLLNRYIGLEDFTSNPTWFYLTNEFTTYSSGLGMVQIDEFSIDLENNKISLHTINSIFTSRDIDIWINDIPIVSVPIEVNPGMTKLMIGSNEYLFTESSYQRITNNFPWTYYFEATNSHGNKIVIDFYNQTSIPINTHGFGFGCFLEFYEDENDLVPTAKFPGRFNDYHIDGEPTAWVGFESDTVKMRASQIPIFE